ncbi:hypothetical protein BJD99_00430 [Rhodococcus sp. 1163]|uniref:MerR family transcriptional regulator n=1 Tax=Rhodococcus sp. 1163 TaxID=1905289 RepID=UPI000A096643|nr:MerR family transcriptional regulator [Rhodococcus sp. 1163]ORI20022.1 hypothetical protein BJD99_00430 [Rhodococcus sp. 1163]
MGLSTRQLAELAGTTLQAVRHYHDVGMLDMPKRSSNGYKQYTVTHLVRLIQIKRLRDLGVGLADISRMSRVDHDLTVTISDLDEQFKVNIARLQKIRSELKSILQEHVPVDVPVEFGVIARDFAVSDRALIMVCSRVLSEDNLKDLRSMLLDRHPLEDELSALPPDAGEATIEKLAERYRPVMRQRLKDFPWLSRPFVGSPAGEELSRELVGQAISALCNPAQNAVTRRIQLIVREETSNPTDRTRGEADVVGS